MAFYCNFDNKCSVIHPMVLQLLVIFTHIPNASTKRRQHTPKFSQNKAIQNVFPYISCKIVKKRHRCFSIIFSDLFFHKQTNFRYFSQFFPNIRRQIGRREAVFFFDRLFQFSKKPNPLRVPPFRPWLWHDYFLPKFKD